MTDDVSSALASSVSGLELAASFPPSTTPTAEQRERMISEAPLA